MKNTFILASTFFFTFSLTAQNTRIADDGSVVPVSNEKQSKGTQQVYSTSSMLCDTVLTTFAAGNGHRGNMFDITALNTITITSFDGHPAGNTDFEIYYRPGTFVGFTSASTGWTLVGSATGVVANTQGSPTKIPIPVNITINANATTAFYVTSTNTAINLNYTDGSTVGNVYKSNTDLQFKEGAGLEYPFSNGGSAFTPRIWNGIIRYCTGTTGVEKEMTVGNVKAYPNPFSTSTTISTGNVKPVNATMIVTDVLGNTVRSMENINAGEIVFEKENLVAGVYFYSLKDSQGLNVKGKLVIE